MDGNGHVVATEFVVKYRDAIGVAGPYSAQELRDEIARYGRSDPEDSTFSNVEWIKEWDSLARGRERSIRDFLDP